MTRQANGGNDDALSDEQVAILAANQIGYDRLLASAPTSGGDAMLTPKGVPTSPPDAVKVGRHPVSGQFVSHPRVPGMPPGHDVAVHDMSQPSHADALIRGGTRQAPSQPNGPAWTAVDRSVVAPRIRTVPPEEMRGAERP